MTTFEELPGATDLMAQAQAEKQARKERKKTRKQLWIEKRSVLLDAFLAGATEGRTWMKEGYSTLEIHGDTLYCHEVISKYYDPICKRLAHNIYIFNSRYPSGTIDDVPQQLMLKLSDKEREIYHMLISGSPGIPTSIIPYGSLDEQTGRLINKLRETKEKLEALTRDPEYNIPQSMEELEDDKERLEELIQALRGVARQQKQEEHRVQLDYLCRYAKWLGKNAEDADYKIGEDTIKSALSTKQQVEEFLEEVDKYLEILKSIPRSANGKD